MEDRYLSKAKRIDNGEWVKGYLVYDNRDEMYRIIIEIHYSTGTCITTDNAPRVDPSTICKCIGLKDDDETLIFKNDVLSLKDEINKCEWKAVVKFGNPNGEYNWGWQLVPITECDANKDILLWVETEMDYMFCEVIGNIFDNPELLEV